MSDKADGSGGIPTRACQDKVRKGNGIDSHLEGLLWHSFDLLEVGND